MPPIFLNSPWPDLGRKIAPKQNELTDYEQSWFFWSIYTIFWQAYLIWISRAAVLLLELRRLYESTLLYRNGGQIARKEGDASTV